MKYPAPLNEIVLLFQGLPERERREMLIGFAENAGKYEPAQDEKYDFVDIRKDEECSDEVGVYLRIRNGDRVRFRVRLGSGVQTLTRAMTSVLCQGFDGVRCSEVTATSREFVPLVVGSELLRQRSRTVYYVLGRMQEAVAAYQRL